MKKSISSILIVMALFTVIIPVTAPPADDNSTQSSIIRLLSDPTTPEKGD